MTKRMFAAAIAIGLIAAPAAAIPVFDASNFSQNILTAARTLEQINNQVRMLQNQAQSLLNQERNLANLPSSILSNLQQTLSRSQALIHQAQGLVFDVNRADASFRQAYPTDYTSLTRDSAATAAQTRFNNSLEALRTATMVQAEVATSLDDDTATVADLTTKSQAATGALQAAQATNQLLALQASQAIQTQRLLLTQGRAAAASDARNLAASAQARATRSRLLGSGAASYAPVPVTLFSN